MINVVIVNLALSCKQKIDGHVHLSCRNVFSSLKMRIRRNYDLALVSQSMRRLPKMYLR